MVELCTNIEFTIRERGKIVGRRASHNIFLNYGRDWFSRLISLSAFGPPLVPEQDARIRYIGFGIGGAKQTAASVLSAPLSTHYPGPNTQTDIDPRASRLERPVRLGWGVGPNVPSGTWPNLTYDPGDVFLKSVQAPVEHPQPTTTRFRVVVTAGEIASATFLSVPISEVGIFPNSANPNLYNNQAISYDTFEPFPKTTGYDVEMTWSFRF